MTRTAAPSGITLCRDLPRRLLETFVERASRERHVDYSLKSAVQDVARLLRASPDATIRVRGTLEGFIAVLHFVAVDVARDVHARREPKLSALGMLLTPCVSRQMFPRVAKPQRTFSREVALSFDF